MYKQIENCRGCGEKLLTDPLIELGYQKLTGIFPKSNSIEVGGGPLSIAKCDACGLVQLAHSYHLNDLYGMNYGYRSGLNQSMVDHLNAKVTSLMKLVPLKKDDVVLDIGSNDGTLLSFYPRNIASAIGFDPSGEKFRAYYPPGSELVVDFFSAKLFADRFKDKKPKIITSISMLYDLEEPANFIQEISEILSDDGIWHFEQSYLPSMIATNAYDTICHEHLEYYSLKQILNYLECAGLKIIEIYTNNINGGSFAITAAKRESKYIEAKKEVINLLNEEEALGIRQDKIYLEFDRRIQKHRSDLVELLRKLKKDGKKVLGYGASTKGNVMLQYCKIDTSLISHIAEVNPDKFGCITPGTNIPIISEKQAKEMNPDYFLVFPWHFKENILKREKDFLQAGGGLIFPLPTIEILQF